MNIAQRQEELLYNMIKKGEASIDASDLAEKIVDVIGEYIDYDRLCTSVNEGNVRGEIGSVIEICLRLHKCGEDAEEEIRKAAEDRVLGKPSVLG